MTPCKIDARDLRLALEFAQDALRCLDRGLVYAAEHSRLGAIEALSGARQQLGAFARVRVAPTVAELMSLDQIICDACDGTGWTAGGTDFALGQVCAKCEGRGRVAAGGKDPANQA